MPSSDRLIFEALESVLTIFPGKRWVIAYSGGLDSTVLLHAAAHVSDSLRAIHINHGLSPDAKAWAEHCLHQARACGVICELLNTEPFAKQKGQSVETWARAQRYQIFEQHLQPDEVLLFAHHQQDQAETLLLNLMRGSGISGLAGMPATRNLGHSYLHRPLLCIPKSVMCQYATQHQLEWVEDPSNQNTDFDRNYLRHKLLPALVERWPQAVASIQQSAEHCQDAVVLVDQHTQSLLATMPKCGGALSLEWLLALSEEAQHQVLRAWFKQKSHRSLPRQALQQLYTDVIDAAEGAEPILVVGDHSIRRYQGKLYVVDEALCNPAAYCIPWDGKQPIKVPAWPHLISIQDLERQGLDIQLLDWSAVTLRSRVGGERCKPKGRQHSQTLKRLYQEYEVQPWERDRIPLLYENEDLKGVISLWSCGC